MQLTIFLAWALVVIGVVGSRAPSGGRKFDRKLGAPGRELASTHEASSIPQARFEQWIDHSNHSLGTFSQLYYYSDEFWGGPGSPVILFTPGESPLEGYETYLTTRRLTGAYAKANKAAVVAVEHRYFGTSSPFKHLSTRNLQYLTVENAIADFEHFARTVKLPFDKKGSTNSPKAPWIFVGGSYSGALAAWTESVGSDAFWAYHASSATVQRLYNYWQYLLPIEEGLRPNCTRDIQRVVEHVDGVLRQGTSQQKHSLKSMFGLQKLEHDDDFAATLFIPLFSFQSLQFSPQYGTDLFEFCDAVEGVSRRSSRLPGRNGVGLKKALANYSYYFKHEILPGYCAYDGYPDVTGKFNVECFNTYNASSPYFTDTSIDNVVNRQWLWLKCNEPMANWRGKTPAGQPTVSSRFVTADYWQRQCSLYFPTGPNGETFGSARGQTVREFNKLTKGWNNTHSKRLMFSNGEFDPWIHSTVSSRFRPGGPLRSTARRPVFVIPKAHHCNDLILENGQANEGVQDVIDKEMVQMKEWIDEFYKH